MHVVHVKTHEKTPPNRSTQHVDHFMLSTFGTGCCSNDATHRVQCARVRLLFTRLLLLLLQSPAGAVIPEGRCYVELQVSCVNDDDEAYKVPSVVYRWKH